MNVCVCLRSRLICETGNIPYHNDRLAGPCKHTRFDPVERKLNYTGNTNRIGQVKEEEGFRRFSHRRTVRTGLSNIT